MNDPVEYRIVGLHLVTGEYLNYNIGHIAVCALRALTVAVLAIEQSVTGERLVTSMDIGDFYHYLNEALEEMNGAGVESDPGDMAPLQEEINRLIELVVKAQRVAKPPQRRATLAKKGTDTCTQNSK